MDPQPDSLAETSQEQSISDPYPPSWVDRLNDSFRNSPIPSPVFYLFLGIAAILVGQIPLWYYDVTPIMSFDTVSFAIGIWISLSLAFIHYLDDLADKALEAFRPALALSVEEFAQQRYTFTTMPARSLILVNLAAFVAFLSALLLPLTVFLIQELVRNLV